MPSKSELHKITIRLTESQLHRLRVLYPNLGYNAVIRALIDAHLAERMSRLTEGITESETEAKESHENTLQSPLRDQEPSGS